MNDDRLQGKQNVFSGEQAILDFLDPAKSAPTPLVELPDSLNPYRKNGVRIFAKMMSMLPLANVKSLPALNILLEARKRGGLDNIDTVIENSSGNTVLSLAVIARQLGIKNTKAIVSHEVSKGKLNLLRFLGTEVIVNEEPICPDPNDPTSGIYKAKKWARENNWFNPGQYDNTDNPKAHYKWTAPQIWEQTEGSIDMLSVGLGTTGSVVGLGEYLKQKNGDISVIGVSRAINNPVPGVRTNNLLREVSFEWNKNVDYQEEIGTVESFRLSLDLCRAGIMVGPSSGFALAGLLSHLSKQDLSESQERVAVFLCPDSPLPYIDEYFEYLDDSDFPKIENKGLLKFNNSTNVSKTDKRTVAIEEVSAPDALEVLFDCKPKELWRLLSEGEEPQVKQGYTVVDTRNSDQFEDHHIPGSVNVPMYKLDAYLKENIGAMKKDEKVFFVCVRGNNSKFAAQKAQMLGINACSIAGGDSEWSRLDLPRFRSEKCVLRYDLDHS